MKTLVTGGAGFIGSHLVDRLVSLGHDVIIFDNLMRGRIENIRNHIESQKVRFIDGDIRNYSEILNASQNIDCMFHLAAQSNVMGAVQDIDYSFYTNVVGTFNALKATEYNKVKRFIFTSSRESYGEAQYLPVDEKHPLMAKNAYGVSKVAGEKYCEVFRKDHNLDVIIFRLANVYGERDFDRVIPIFIDNLVHKKDLIIYGGQQVIDFISIEIVIDALLHAMNKAEPLYETINIGSGVGTRLFELAERLLQLIPSKSKINIQPAREKEVVKFTASIEKMKQVLNLSPPNDPLYFLEKMNPL